jgi:signal transduction histidine kinase
VIHPSPQVCTPEETPAFSFEKRWVRWALIFGCWTLVGSFYATRPYLSVLSQGNVESSPEVWRVLVGNLADAYTWALFTPLIFWLARRFRFPRGGWLLALAVHLVAATVLTALVVRVNASMASLLWPEEPSPFTRYFAATFHWNVQWYVIVVGIRYALDTYERYRERQLRASQLETQLVQAQLQALKTQLQPHFLFNTLHTISELVHEDIEAADRMITRLGDLLRLSMDNAGAQEVSLKQELEFLDAYLEIEQTRFHDRLKVVMDVDPEVLDARVPNLLLQPLVENAIRHGLAVRARPGRVEIHIKRRHGELEIRVRDDGVGISGRAGNVREGIGLGNTRARLRQLYGAAHALDLRNAPEGGVVVTLRLPFRPAPAEIAAPRRGTVEVA